MAIDADWQTDAARCGLGCPADAQPARDLLLLVYWLLNTPVKFLTGISFQTEARIGSALQIWHFVNVLIRSNTVIGASCTRRHDVSLCERYEGGPAQRWRMTWSQARIRMCREICAWASVVASRSCSLC